MPRTASRPKPGLPRLVRRLPRPIAPFPQETITSYLRRLELANGLPTDRTGANLGIRNGDNLLWMLRVLTGRPAVVLRQALPQLSSTDSRVPPTIHGEAARPHAACLLCCRSAGADQHVRRWVTHDEVVCLRHRRWLGSPEEETDEQLDLTAHPDVLAAGRRHRNLITRHGRPQVHAAYEVAARIVWDWQLQNRRLPEVSARLDRLRGNRSCTYMDSAVHAAQYPAAIALTSLLSSPYWRRQAFNLFEEPIQRFLQRVADTVTDGYYPTGGQDPLRDYLNHGGSAVPSESVPLGRDRCSMPLR